MERIRHATGTPWEPLAGYSRAVRAGPFVHVSGTTATDAEGRIVAPGDAYAQAVQTIRNIETALVAVGARLADVVRTRIYVTDVGCWEEIARAHREHFGEVRPATTLIEVSRLVSPEMLVEIEAEAIVDESTS